MTRRRARPRSSAEAVRALVVELLDEDHRLRRRGYSGVGRPVLTLGRDDVLVLAVTMQKWDCGERLRCTIMGSFNVGVVPVG